MNAARAVVLLGWFFYMLESMPINQADVLMLRVGMKPSESFRWWVDCEDARAAYVQQRIRADAMRSAFGVLTIHEAARALDPSRHTTECREGDALPR